MYGSVLIYTALHLEKKYSADLQKCLISPDLMMLSLKISIKTFYHRLYIYL